MDQQDKFERIIATLHEAAFDYRLWPRASALIDELVGTAGSHLIIMSGHARDDVDFVFGDYYNHGEFAELGREYAQNYFPHDERIPRVLRLPDSRVVHITEVYTESELKTSPTYNELLLRSRGRNGLLLRMDGPEGLHIGWAFTDPKDPTGWGSAQLTFLTRLLPHIRQFVRVRQALASAEALRTSLTRLLDNATIGVLSLDRRGTIIETNARALSILQRSDSLMDTDGFLGARSSTDNATLQRLIARALPRWGHAVASGSLTLKRSPGKPPLTLHIHPVGPRADFGAPRVAALVLIIDPVQRPQIDPVPLAATLGLSRAESQVAAALARGYSVRDIANATHRTQAAIRWHIRQMHTKLGISRQADLVRIVLMTAGVPLPRD